jgi:hypothetical protein
MVNGCFFPATGHLRTGWAEESTEKTNYFYADSKPFLMTP